MIRIAVCDDDLKICEIMEEYITQICQDLKVKLELYTYESGMELCKQMEQGETYELLFLDIEMPQINGVQVGTYIRDNLRENSVQIAYISGDESYAMQLFDTRPINFLVKPLKYEALESVIDKVVSVTDIMSQKFVYRKNQDTYFVDYGKIIYFKSNNRKVEIVLENKRMEFYGKLEDIYSSLPKAEFLYIHKSFIANIRCINMFEYDTMTMSNGEILPISQSRRKEIRMVHDKILSGE